ncbi:MAG: PH domain-containing protein [Pseudonocardiales bacterium]|nr:PH domain-containing protein [Pseudonocardiales bacterium]
MTSQTEPESAPQRRVFRISPLGILAALALAICATPVAFGLPGLVYIYLVPLGIIVWVLRTRTVVDADAVTVRRVLRSRRVPWDRIASLRLGKKAKVSAVLTDGAELPLPAVRVRDLPQLAAVSGGRLPDPSPAEE